MSDAAALYLCVGLGSGLGGMGRFWISGLLAGTRVGETFPLGTLVVNVTGSFLIGLVAALTGPDGRLAWSQRAIQFFMAGLCGGFTTFSSFSLQTLNLVHEGEHGAALLNIILSVATCLLSVWLGYAGGQALNR